MTLMKELCMGISVHGDLSQTDRQQQACLILSYITAPYLHDSKFRKAAEKNGTFYNVLPDLEDGIQDAAFKVRMRRLLQKAIYRL